MEKKSPLFTVISIAGKNLPLFAVIRITGKKSTVIHGYKHCCKKIHRYSKLLALRESLFTIIGIIERSQSLFTFFSITGRNPWLLPLLKKSTVLHRYSPLLTLLEEKSTVIHRYLHCWKRNPPIFTVISMAGTKSSVISIAARNLALFNVTSITGKKSTVIQHY